jgi:hypothetical protein
MDSRPIEVAYCTAKDFEQLMGFKFSDNTYMFLRVYGRNLDELIERISEFSSKSNQSLTYWQTFINEDLDSLVFLTLDEYRLLYGESS